MKKTGTFRYRKTLKDGMFEVKSTIETNRDSVVLNEKKLQSVQRS